MGTCTPPQAEYHTGVGNIYIVIVHWEIYFFSLFTVLCHLFSLYDGRTSTSHVNAHTQFFDRMLKLFSKFTSYFGCFLMCLLLGPMVDFF